MIGQDISQLSIGIVTQLHKSTMGRVKVQFPHLDGTESDWCSVMSPMGGADRGMVMIPEVGDHVLVAFEQGDTQRGFILGAVWNQNQKIPAGDGKFSENNLRFIRSRSGHCVRLDDTKGKEKIEIVDGATKHRIVIDMSKKKIQIECDDGDIQIHAKSGKISVEAQEISVKGTNIKIEASSVLTLKGNIVNIN